MVVLVHKCFFPLGAIHVWSSSFASEYLYVQRFGLLQINKGDFAMVFLDFFGEVGGGLGCRCMQDSIFDLQNGEVEYPSVMTISG